MVSGRPRRPIPAERPRARRPTPLLPARLRLRNRLQRFNRRRARSRALPRYVAQTVYARGVPHVVTLTPNRAGGPNADPVQVQTMLVDLFREEIQREVHAVRGWNNRVIGARVSGNTTLTRIFDCYKHAFRNFSTSTHT